MHTPSAPLSTSPVLITQHAYGWTRWLHGNSQDLTAPCMPCRVYSEQLSIARPYFHS